MHSLMHETVGDLLLRWMSETGSGSLADLRGRIDWICRTVSLHLPPAASGRWLRDLASLGHCEVDWSAGRWAIAPAALVRLPGGDGLAVLAGSRRPRTVTALTDYWGGLDTARRERPQDDVPLPMSLYVRFTAEADLVSASEAAKIDLAGLAAERIARALPRTRPSVRSASPAYTSRLKRLHTTQPRQWEEVDAAVAVSSPADGLYCEHVHGRWRYLYVENGVWLACDLSTGVFAELAARGESALRWRPDPARHGADAGTLFVDWGAPLPPLHSRSLVLCTGLPPRFGQTATTTIYENVPRGIAARVCESLGQPLVID